MIVGTRASPGHSRVKRDHTRTRYKHAHTRLHGSSTEIGLAQVRLCGANAVVDSDKRAFNAALGLCLGWILEVV